MDAVFCVDSFIVDLFGLLMNSWREHFSYVLKTFTSTSAVFTVSFFGLFLNTRHAAARETETTQTHTQTRRHTDTQTETKTQTDKDKDRKRAKI
jgi:carbohydrate-binding DOMON domain-containing protein